MYNRNSGEIRGCGGLGMMLVWGGGDCEWREDGTRGREGGLKLFFT